jgi:hypothetical protein
MKKSSLALCILILIAWTWVLWLWIRYGLLPPTEITPLILSDLQFLGPFAIILDIIILSCLYLVIKPILRKRDNETEDSSLREPLDNKTDN